jgi:hypothetical protein
MRHLYGVALAVLLAAAVFFGAAWGYSLVIDGVGASAAANSGQPAAGGGGLPAAGGSLFLNGHVMLGGGLMLAVGLAIGLLMVLPRVSPLASGLPGLVLVAWTALYVTDVREAVKLIPWPTHGFGQGFEILLFDGLLGLAGLAMIVPLFVPSRWRLAPRSAGYTPRMAGYTGPEESVLPRRAATVSPGTGDPDLDEAVAGFTAPSGGDSNVIIDRTQTLPQRGQVVPPDGDQAPWGPPD